MTGASFLSSIFVMEIEEPYIIIEEIIDKENTICNRVLVGYFITCRMLQVFLSLKNVLAVLVVMVGFFCERNAPLTKEWKLRGLRLKLMKIDINR